MNELNKADLAIAISALRSLARQHRARASAIIPRLAYHRRGSTEYTAIRDDYDSYIALADNFQERANRLEALITENAG